MSWYVTLAGKQVWADREDTFYTLGDAPEEELPFVELAYLSVSSTKAVFAEHSIDEDDKKGKKAKEKPGARSRGYVVRVEGDSRTKVTSNLQAAADRLVTNGVVSRIDVDDLTLHGKRKGKKKETAEPQEEILPPLAANECRVEITCRCTHFAHGKGFRVLVLEPGTKQQIHVFVADQDLNAVGFHKHLVEAIEATGGKTAIGRMMASAEDGGGEGGGRAATAQPPPPKKRDEAREDEDDWLSSVMGRCMVPKKGEEKPDKTEAGATEAEGGEGGEGGEDAPKPKAKPKRELPPWLRR